VVQHGYAHRNHAPGRRTQLGAGESPAPAPVDGRARRGRISLERRSGGVSRRCSSRRGTGSIRGSSSNYRNAGFRACRPSGRGHRQCPSPALCSATRTSIRSPGGRDRAFIGVDAAIDRLVRISRRAGKAPSILRAHGLLTHHLDFPPPPGTFWPISTRTRARHGAATWIDVDAAFGGVLPSDQHETARIGASALAGEHHLLHRRLDLKGGRSATQFTC
jgi:hypothetical protein